MKKLFLVLVILMLTGCDSGDKALGDQVLGRWEATGGGGWVYEYLPDGRFTIDGDEAGQWRIVDGEFCTTYSRGGAPEACTGFEVDGDYLTLNQEVDANGATEPYIMRRVD